MQVRFDFDEPDFSMIDTLFSLAEAHLFMQLVELQDNQPSLLPAGKTRPDLYRSVTPQIAEGTSILTPLSMNDALDNSRPVPACCLLAAHALTCTGESHS